MRYKNINIKMFEDVFQRKEDDNDIEIETVLTKCKYVFVYISDNFYTSKLRRLGLKECCIKDALEGRETKTHFKIVCYCGHWKLPDDRHLTIKPENVDLDYFLYVEENPDIVLKYKKTYKDCLDTIQHK